jgi:radical SAM protein with 4Fe4S-binding SPASM domain
LPWSGSLELTERCNNRCIHCYINQPAGDRNLRERELTQAEVRSIIDQIVDAGCLWLLLTGGEVLLRPDFLEIYTYAKRKGLLLTVFTNGTLLTPEIADYLAEWPPLRLEITLYGRSREVYEAVTGVPGSYARCRQGIELALDRGLPLRLKTTLCQANLHELEAMQEFAEELRVDFRFDPLLNARIDDRPLPDGLRLSPEQVVALDVEDPQRMAEWNKAFQRVQGPPVDPDKLFFCMAGSSSFHIDAYGRLSICMMLRQPSYDLRNGTFAQGWHEFIPALQATSRHHQTPCQECQLLSLCDQCPAWSQIEYGPGQEERPVPYLCQIAHLRDQLVISSSD